MTGRLEVVRLLLEAEAHKDWVTLDKGKTALHFAARRGHSQVAKLLLEYGAEKDIATADVHGKTPLHIAAFHGHDEVVRLLLEFGAKKELATADNGIPAALVLLIRWGTPHG